MNILKTIAVAFSMFSALPMPQFEWTRENMRFSLCAFPLIGLVIGAVCFGFSLLPLPHLLISAGLCLIPVLITGGIHLDGYADTSDALASHADRDRKLQILKDPNCGAFAVIRLICYFIAYFSLTCTLRADGRALLLMTLAYCLERCLSGMAVASFPLAKNSGLAYTFAEAADKRKVYIILAACAALLALAMLLLGGILMLIAAGLVFLLYRRTAEKEFGGITGDLAGWFLQRAELWMLGALVLSQIKEII